MITEAVALAAWLLAPPSPQPAPSPRVFTEEDLARTRGVTASPSPSPKAGSRPAPSRPSASPTPIWPSSGPDTTAAEEKQWRGRGAQARARISSAEARVAAAEQRIVELRQDSGAQISLQDPNREQTRAAQITAAEKELDSARTAVQAARQAQADLEDEARRKNVPPGWLRE
jgi:hypothetical protein